MKSLVVTWMSHGCHGHASLQSGVFDSVHFKLLVVLPTVNTLSTNRQQYEKVGGVVTSSTDGYYYRLQSRQLPTHPHLPARCQLTYTILISSPFMHPVNHFQLTVPLVIRD